MLCQIYGVNHNSMKWWHQIFFGLLVNAYVLYCDAQDKPVSLLVFRRELAQGLFTLGKTRSSMGAPKRQKLAYGVPDSVHLSNTGMHWPEFINKKGRCEVRSNECFESRPISICSHCGVHLCCNNSKNCFVKYHM